MSSNGSPTISVVMPVHNALPFLDESIASILKQTLRSFEFVILDDASTDGSYEALEKWASRDQRIKLHRSTKQLGLAASSNAVVGFSRAPLIARMDADDIAHPDRLQRQLEVISAQPGIAAIGTLCNGIDAHSREVRPRDRWRLFLRSSIRIPFPHGSVMFRRSIFDRVGGYDEDYLRGEDHDLFLRMSEHGRVVTLPDNLYSYRYHSTNATLFNSVSAVGEGKSSDVYDFYMLGAMRLWAGEPPMLLEAMMKRKSWPWNAKTVAILVSAFWGHVSPSSLRLFMRSSIRIRDLVAGLKVKAGRPYDWRLK